MSIQFVLFIISALILTSKGINIFYAYQLKKRYSIKKSCFAPMAKQLAFIPAFEATSINANPWSAYDKPTFIREQRPVMQELNKIFAPLAAPFCSPKGESNINAKVEPHNDAELILPDKVKF